LMMSLKYAYFASATLSLLGGICMAGKEIHRYMKGSSDDELQKKIQQLKTTFILTLAFADICFSSIFWGAFFETGTGTRCEIEAILFEFFALSSVLWTCTNCYFWFMESAYLRTPSCNRISESEEIRKMIYLLGISVIVCWGFPIIGTTIFFVYPSLEVNQQDFDLMWCHYRNVSFKSWQWIGFSFAPLLLGWLFNVTLLVLHTKSGCSHNKDENKEEKEITRSKTGLDIWFWGYTGGFLFVWTGHIVDRLLLSQGIHNSWLMLFHAFTEPLQGFINALVYVLVLWKQHHGAEYESLLENQIKSYS